MNRRAFLKAVAVAALVPVLPPVAVAAVPERVPSGCAETCGAVSRADLLTLLEPPPFPIDAFIAEWRNRSYEELIGRTL